jgi:hypothetical protein
MTQMLIVDEKAPDFYVNNGSFPFVDPSTGVRFEPEVQVKVKQSDWMKGQPCIQKVEKPSK